MKAANFTAEGGARAGRLAQDLEEVTKKSQNTQLDPLMNEKFQLNDAKKKYFR